jgi:hypothetical protein
MQMKKSYHSMSNHSSGRCPTQEEYREAITYASRYPLAQKHSLRILLADHEMSKRIWSWYESITTIPLNYDGMREEMKSMLLYYWVPFGGQYDNITHQDMSKIANADGDSWGGISDAKTWNIMRDHLSTLYLHVAYVTSYLKNQHNMMSQNIINQIGKYPTSFRENFPELGELTQPILTICHHTSPQIVNSRMHTWTHDKVSGGSEIWHVSNDHSTQRNYTVSLNGEVSPIRHKSDLPVEIKHFSRYENLYFDNVGETDSNAHSYYSTTPEGNSFD